MPISKESGQVGDLIGGVLNPIIATIAALLTFLAFYIQYQANELQKRSIAVERIESRFFEMIKLHRENVSEMSIQGPSFETNNRKAFYTMLEELKYVYSLLEYDYWIKHEVNPNSDYFGKDLDLFKAAYVIFFFGVNEKYDKTTKY